MPKNVVVIGAGGHGRVVADIIRASGDLLVGFLDDAEIPFVPLLGKVCDCEKYKDNYFFVAIGDNEIRHRIVEQYPDLKYYTAIHPTAIIGSDVSVGEGTCVMPATALNNGTQIGRHCIINTHATVEHDCIIGDYAHISPGAVLCGTVGVGKKTQVGAGSVVKNNIQITDEVVIGVGGVVVKNIIEKGTYVGVPAVKK